MKPQREFMIKFIMKTWGGGREQLDRLHDLAIEHLFKQAEEYEPPAPKRFKEQLNKRKPHRAPKKFVPNVKPLVVKKIKI